MTSASLITQRGPGSLAPAGVTEVAEVTSRMTAASGLVREEDLSPCSGPAAVTGGPAAASFVGWGGSIGVMVSSRSSLGSATRIARRVAAEVEQVADRFRADAQLHRLGGGRPAAVSDLLVRLLEAELVVSRATGGLVDPTMAPVLDALGYDRELALVRRRARAISPHVVRAGAWREIIVDAEHSRVSVPSRVRLDLGAVAGAWVADSASRRIADEFGVVALVAVGQDVASAFPAVGRGSRAVTGSWEVDVATHGSSGRRTLELSFGECISTVSRAARRWSAGGHELHDIIDPRTTMPVTGPLTSVSVVGRSAVEANLWALAALVGQSPAIADGQPGLRTVHVVTD